jgi:hypothetical protein
MIKPLAKRIMFALAPRAAASVFSARARAHSHRVVEEWGLGEVTRKLIAQLGAAVRGGPFSGMVLSPMTYKEHLGPFLLGTYESEIHAWIRALRRRPPTQVIDIGSRFGYYAVGLARLLPNTPVVAFDPDRWARRATREMAEANDVSVTIRGCCTPRWLRTNLRPGSFVLSDCEGFERELFCSGPIPAMRTSAAIIELHENFVPGITESIRAAFASTHDLDFVTARERSMPEDIDLGFLAPEERRRAINEVRGNEQWVLLTPRSSHRANGT